MRRLFIIGWLLWWVSMMTYADGADCAVVVDDLPAIKIGLVYPSDTFLIPGRIDFFQGALGMLQTINRCSENQPIEWVQATAEDYEGALLATQELVMEHNVQLIVGGGSSAIGEGLADAARNFDIIVWETTDGLSGGGHNAFSVTNSSFQRGLNVADFIRATYGDKASVALIYNERDHATQIADGIRSVLKSNVVIDEVHAESIPAHDIALAIRRQEIDVVVSVTFQTIADSLWVEMREVDANVQGWLNVGDPGYRVGLCRRIGETDGLITIHRFAMTNPDNEMFHQFATDYQEEFGEYPSERAHLTASGMYMLLTYVLPQLDDDPSVESIRDAIYNATATIGDGLMGEGLSLSADSGSNELASLVVQQNQNGEFCTVAPSALATCSTVEQFSTWRDRAIIQDEQGCTEPWADPDL